MKHMAHLKQIEQKNWNFIVYVIEQGDELPFWWEWLFNIGIHEVSKQQQQQQQQHNNNKMAMCIVTHDVDIFANETVTYNWCDRPTQICSELSCFGGGVPYPTSAGGVISVSLEHWNVVNGMTNTAFGWGGEDDDLFYQFRQCGLLEPNTGLIRRPPKGQGQCNCLNDDDHTERKSDPEKYNEIVQRIGRMGQGSKEWKSDGLNDLKYTVAARTVDDFGSHWLTVTDPLPSFFCFC